MKVIDHSAPGKPGQKQVVINRVRNRLGQSWNQKEAQAQEVVIEALQKVLDNRYMMLRSVVLEGPDVPIPLILVGPQGVWVIYASTSKGIFRAKEDTWEEIDNRTQEFKIARPNLLTRTLLMARAVEAFLVTHGLQVPTVEPVLFFSDPGTHVDSTRPIVRVVLADALDRLAASLIATHTLLDQDVVQRIVELLNRDHDQVQPVGPVVSEKEDAFSFRDLPEDDVRQSMAIDDKSESPLIKRVPFTSRQWLVLGLLVLVNIVIITAFVVLILASS